MRTRTIIALTCSVLACHDGSSTAKPVPEQTEPAPAIERERAVDLPGIAMLARSHAADIVDVVLSPDASAALTLDRDGGVRLWPALDGTRDPLVIPIDDPNQLSLARSAHGFVIATLDTIGTAEVYEARDHDGELRLDSLFSSSPIDPLFELHVLDKGERLLALGVDHRVRLYDARGTELSVIADHGFVPWQLRHVETPTGIALVAILAGPTRVQPLSLRDDFLQLAGDPIPIELDRGPNRNDLALTPDGTHIAAFSRRKWRSGEWKLQLLALADGRETIIEGKIDSEARPRMHLLDGQRMLLDDGTGVGQIVSLNHAVPNISTRPLPGSSEPTRLFTSVERGVRVVPTGDHFIVDRLDGGGEHVRLGRVPTPMHGVGLSPDGTRVIWALADRWAIEPIDGSAVQPTIHSNHASSLLAADFVDDERVVVVNRDGQLQLVHSESGEELASAPASVMLTPPQLTEARLSRANPPMLLVRDMATRLDTYFEITDGFVPRTSKTVSAPFIEPSAGSRDDWTSIAWTHADWWETSPSEQALETELARLVSREHVDIRDVITLPDDMRVFAAGAASHLLVRVRPNDGSGMPKLEAMNKRSGILTVVRLAASPTGDRIAAVLHDGSISVHDATSLEREWTRVDTHASALGWSTDGNRLVVAGLDGGAVLDSKTGEIVLERRDFGLHVERVANSSIPQAAATDPESRL